MRLCIALWLTFAGILTADDVDIRVKVKRDPAAVAAPATLPPPIVIRQYQSPVPCETCRPVLLIPARPVVTYAVAAEPCPAVAVSVAPARRYRVVRDGPVVRAAAAVRTLFGCD